MTYDVQIGTRLVSGDVIRLVGPCGKDGRSRSPLVSDESNPSPSWISRYFKNVRTGEWMRSSADMLVALLLFR